MDIFYGEYLALKHKAHQQKTRANLTAARVYIIVKRNS
jgi:hypothetical protein